MIKFIENNLPAIIELCKKHNLKSLYLFGSATQYDKAKIEELQYADNYFNFLFFLENILKRNIDLMPKEKLKNHIYQGKSIVRK